MTLEFQREFISIYEAGDQMVYQPQKSVSPCIRSSGVLWIQEKGEWSCYHYNGKYKKGRDQAGITTPTVKRVKLIKFQ